MTQSEARALYIAGNNAGRGYAPDEPTVDIGTMADRRAHLKT